MTYRTRNLTIDNDSKLVLLDVEPGTEPNYGNIVGAKKSLLVISHGSAKSAIKPAKGIGNKSGYLFLDGAYIPLLKLNIRGTHIGQPIIIRSRYGLTNTAALLNTDSYQEYEIPLETPINNWTEYTMNTTIPAGERIYFDVLQGGIKRTGYGLQIELQFYKG